MLEVVTKRHIQFPTQHVEGLLPPSAVTIKCFVNNFFLVTGHTLKCISMQETACVILLLLLLLLLLLFRVAEFL
jgi:hypothetical protein